MTTWMLSDLFHFILSTFECATTLKTSPLAIVRHCSVRVRFPSGVHLFSRSLHIQDLKRLNPSPLKQHCNPFYDLVFLLFFASSVFSVSFPACFALTLPSLTLIAPLTPFFDFVLYLNNTPFNILSCLDANTQ